MTTSLANSAVDSVLERWFFTVIAGEFLLIALVGFAPNSIAILEGTKDSPPLLIHVHAALMFSWMVGFFSQAYFISTRKIRAHIQAGRILFVLGVCILSTFVYFSLFMDNDGFGRIQIPMEAERIGFFSLLLCLAFINRKRNTEAHKRFILLATLIPLDAGLNRMPWLPTFGLGWGTPIWVLILLSQLFLFDWMRLGRIHSATILGGTLIGAYWIGMIFWVQFFA